MEEQHEEWETRLEAFEAPGWDVEEIACNDLNKNSPSYARSFSIDSTIQLNTLTPMPSQRMDTLFNGKVYPITLDSGATLSFVRKNEI